MNSLSDQKRKNQIQMSYGTPKRGSGKKLDFDNDDNQNFVSKEEENNLHLVDFSKFKTNTPTSSRHTPNPSYKNQNFPQMQHNTPSTDEFELSKHQSGRNKLISRILNSMEIEQPVQSAQAYSNVKRSLLFLNDEVVVNSTPKKVCLQAPQLLDVPFKKNLFSSRMNSNEYDQQQTSSLEILEEKFDLDYIDDESNNSRFTKDYTQLSIIGHGHFGTVYKCRNNYDNHIYAIKCTKSKNKITNGKTEAVNEAQALAFLSAKGDNPYIVRYYTSWTEGNSLYLALELCDSSLKRILRKKQDSNTRFIESQISGILKDITEGLKHLHFLKIVHLDIKPENILYSKNKKCFKIADLGMSRISMLKQGEDVNEGDARYLASELLNDIDDQKEYELTKSDIFSLGSSMLELILNEDLPKNGLQWHKLRKGLNDEDFGLHRNEFSTALKDLIKSMMQPQQEKRPSAAEILQNPYFTKQKENNLKWERIRGTKLRKQLEDLKTSKQSRSKSV